MPAGHDARRRVFFALWPQPETRAALVAAYRDVVAAVGGDPTADGNLHITVAFLGGLDAAGLTLARAVPPIRVGEFELVLERVAFRRRAQMLWATPLEVPAALAALERRLWNGLERRGFERETRPFRPHLTLARRVCTRCPAVRRRLSFRVTALTLVESLPADRGTRYVPLDHWPL
jgi:RNA 2',3'-cyclic 3'-phosphodiesterase